MGKKHDVLASGKVEAYIESLPESEKELVHQVRGLIFDSIPEVEEKFSFKIPFYHYYGMFCYINHLKKEGGIELAFCRGKDLVLAFPELELKGRVMIAGISFQAGQKISAIQLRLLIIAAAEWQKEAWMAKKPFVKLKNAD